MNKPCAVCRDINTRTIYLLEGCNVRECLSCGLRYADLHLPQNELMPLYDTDCYDRDHFSFYVPGIEKKIIQDYVQEFLEVERRFPLGGEVLDIGCSNGAFLAELDTKWRKFGLDLSPLAIEKARREVAGEFYVGDAESLDLGQERCDVITVWMLIEHVQDPLRFIEKTNQWLRPGGQIVLKTPNRKSLLYFAAFFLYRVSRGRIRKPLSFFYNPQHIYFFTVFDLIHMLEASGFRLEKVEQGERYVTRYALSRFPIIFRWALKITAFLSKIMHREDSITVYATKIRKVEALSPVLSISKEASDENINTCTAH